MINNTEKEISSESLKRIIPREDNFHNIGSGYVCVDKYWTSSMM